MCPAGQGYVPTESVIPGASVADSFKGNCVSLHF